MAQQSNSLRDQISQLEAARNLVLGDAAFYPQIVNGILPIIGVSAQLELRRWGADFLAETFASPALAAAQKEQLAGPVLQTLKDILELPEEDIVVLQSVVQAAASLYPIVFRHIINHPEDTAMWEKMTGIKQNILRRWDSAPYPVKVCCIKFVQRVVHVQTVGSISDPRRPDKNETSLSIVPRNHAILSLPNLEAESSGLLDRLLTVFQEDSSDAILVNATLNCLAVLIRSRQSIANKIIDAVLNFDPLKQANGPMTPTLRVNVKSMERTTRSLLINVLKRNPSHPLAGKIQQYIDRLSQPRPDILDETSRKRGLPVEPTDGLDNAKRAKLGAEAPALLKIPPLPPGPISFAQLYTLTEDVGLSTFDVKQLPIDLMVKITVPVLARVDQGALNQALEAVKSRYQTLSAQQAPKQPPAVEEEDEYEPEYSPMDIPDNVIGETQAVSAEVAEEAQPDLVSLGPFILPQPPPLTEDEANEIGISTAERVFSMVTAMDAPRKPAKGPSQQQLGFSRLAGSTFDRDAWVTLLTRLATRASGGLESEESIVKTEEGLPPRKPTISDSIRELLYRHILEDFRSRINIGITWLNEEWYNDRVQLKFAGSQRVEDSEEVYVPLHYDRWVLRLLDGILPYVDARDKVLIRFLSEIPEINPSIIERVKSLARDPERVNLCVQALLYLVMFRPPARELCLDALEDIYRTYEESRPVAGKFLAKWRPHVVEPQQSQPVKALQQAETTPTSNGTEPSETPAVQQPQQEMSTAAG